jgi:hypothetical protein
MGPWRRSAAQLSPAKQPVDRGGTDRYEYAPRTPSELPYASWREFATKRSLRLFALRLHEAGMIRSSPNQAIANRSDLALPRPARPIESSCTCGCGRQAGEGGMRRRILVDEDQKHAHGGGK